MGRDAKFNREVAVEICMQQIWRYGFEACSVKAISETLGITRSSFYHAFGSREALFLEVLEYYFTLSPDKVLNNADEAKSVCHLLTDFFIDICRVRAADSESKGCLAVNGIAELVGVNEYLGPILTDAVSSSAKRLEYILYQAALKGEIHDDGRLREKALALQSLMVGLNLMSKVIHCEKDLQAIVRQTLSGLGLYMQT